MTSDFYQPTDIDLLRMENDLLAHENRFLKARLHDANHDDASRKARRAQPVAAAPADRDVVEPVEPVEPERAGPAVARAVTVESADTLVVPAATMKRLRQAERDIKSVMNSIQRRRFVRFYLNRRRGYQTLLKRYAKAPESSRR
jgi:hypothetical protein